MLSRSTVEKYISYGLNPVPVRKGTKEPVRKNHTSKMHEDEIDDFTWKDLEIGVSTGFNSLNLEVIDFDLKNSEDPDKVMKIFKSKVPLSLLNKLVVQKTQSGGYHMIYRCEDISSSMKLAKNKNGEAIIETRGEGGYIKCYPSSGYEIIQGSFDKIPIITPEERLQLFISAKMLNTSIIKEARKKQTKEDVDYLKKFPDYNEDINIGIDLLLKNGWTIHSEDSIWVNMSRPETKSGDLHGGYHKEGKFFYCFSTAQDVFEIERPYNNHAIFAELECGGRYNVAYAKLYDMGYGTDEIKDDEEPEDFISSFDEENEYLDQARKGEIPLGVSLGWSCLDDFFRLKKNTFYFFVGLDNIGKSTLLSSIMVATKTLHGYKWGISSPEALIYTTRRNLIEAQIGKEIKSLANNTEEYRKLLVESREYFHIIKNEKHYTIDEVLEKGKILYQKYGIDFLIIDPFSFYSGSGNFSEDTEVLSKIRVFCQNYCSVIVVDHPSTEFARRSVGQDGFVKMPTKYDVSGGSSKANRTDDFIVFHRIINHPDPDVRRTMQISVQKVKDKATGGKPHTAGEWSELIWENRNGFIGYWDLDGNNPMYNTQESKKDVRTELKRMTPEEAF